jgi:hypothetical protein
MALAGSLVWLVSAALLGVAQDGSSSTEPQFVRLKPADPEMRRLMTDGYRRSETFRALVDEIHRSNAVVVVQYGQCGKGRFRSCVTDVAGDRRQRAIRIKIDTRTTDDRLMATVAHELAHALEILREPDVFSAETTLNLYRRIGMGKCREGLSDACETDAALAAEARVLDEIGRGARR